MSDKEAAGAATTIHRLLIRLTIVFRMNGAEPQKNIAETHLKYAKDAYWKIPLTFALIVGGIIVLCLLIVLYATFFR